MAIPTYQRASSIAVTGTLNFLRQANYPSELIYLFVASDDEKRLYENIVPAHLYYNIIVGVLGLANQRNFITDYFPEDEVLLQMDDDVKGVKTNPFMSFTDLVLKGVKVIDTACGLWGIMPNDDGRKMSEKTTIHLTHIIGCFFIYKNHREVRITINEKEDFERSILYFQLYGSVARYKGAGVNTNYQTNPGGLQSPGRHERMLEDMIYLAHKYPDYVIAVNKTKGADIMLNWRAI